MKTLTFNPIHLPLLIFSFSVLLVSCQDEEALPDPDEQSEGFEMHLSNGEDRTLEGDIAYYEQEFETLKETTEDGEIKTVESIGTSFTLVENQDTVRIFLIQLGVDEFKEGNYDVISIWDLLGLGILIEENVEELETTIQEEGEIEVAFVSVNLIDKETLSPMSSPEGTQGIVKITSKSSDVIQVEVNDVHLTDDYTLNGSFNAVPE